MVVSIPARADFSYRLCFLTSPQHISLGRELSRSLRGEEQITVEKVKGVVSSFSRWSTFYSVAYRPILWIVLPSALIISPIIFPLEEGFLLICMIAVNTIVAVFLGLALADYSYINKIAANYREIASEANEVLERLDQLDDSLEIRLNYA